MLRKSSNPSKNCEETPENEKQHKQRPKSLIMVWANLHITCQMVLRFWSNWPEKHFTTMEKCMWIEFYQQTLHIQVIWNDVWCDGSWMNVKSRWEVTIKIILKREGRRGVPKLLLGTWHKFSMKASGGRTGLGLRGSEPFQKQLEFYRGQREITQEPFWSLLLFKDPDGNHCSWPSENTAASAKTSNMWICDAHCF